MEMEAIKCSTAVRVGLTEMTFVHKDKAQIVYEEAAKTFFITCRKTARTTLVFTTNVQYAIPKVMNEGYDLSEEHGTIKKTRGPGRPRKTEAT